MLRTYDNLSFMFITAFSPYLEDVTKQYSDDDPESWMKPIETADSAALPAGDDTQVGDDTQAGNAKQTGNDKQADDDK